MHLLLCTTGPQQGQVHTGHMDQGALASIEAVRGWCQVTQLPDPAITLPKFVHAHNRLPETCCASHKFVLPSRYPHVSRGGVPLPSKAANSTIVLWQPSQAAAHDSENTLKENKECASAKRGWVGENNAQ